MKITRRSIFTGKEHTMEIPCTPEQLADYQNGTLIQKAMPNVPPSLREFVINGVTPDEWDKYIGEPEDDGDEYTGPCYPEYDE